jgi:hypothetical protein
LLVAGCVGHDLAGRREHDAFLSGFLAGQRRRKAALVHDEDSIGHPKNLGQLRRDQQYTDALHGQLGEQAVNLALGLDIDAAGRLVDDEHGRVARQPLGEDDLLLIATGQGGNGVADAAGF